MTQYRKSGASKEGSNQNGRRGDRSERSERSDRGSEKPRKSGGQSFGGARGGNRGGNGGGSRSGVSSTPKIVRGPRPKQGQKTMEADYSILVKTAKPQAIEDYTPSKTFAEHGLNDHIVSNLKLKGYTQPTPIQDQAIPHILKGKDIIGVANTGTGKTAAFLLPLIHQVSENPTKKCVLILAPTRELVTQIHKELKSFTNSSEISSTVVIGGENIDKQIRELRKKKNFIIATTGRGLDLIEHGNLRMQDVDTIVLDEMDQMLDMGFIRDIRKVLEFATNLKHLLFFSATTSPSIEKIALELLNKPVMVSVVKGQTTDNVEQSVIEIGVDDNKFEKLCELLTEKENADKKGFKAIVFENTKHGAARIEKDLNKRGFRTLAIHGNKNQNQRTRALDAFKAGNINVLIATNVAARGLDIPMVSDVINYSLPQTKEDYVHRIGRTGRAGEVGRAWSFVVKK
jgi:ATP-dependent RNA helicase RhlE